MARRDDGDTAEQDPGGSSHTPAGRTTGSGAPGPAGAERVTLRDVARQAETSTATVSRSLRDDPQISPATRRRVKQVAEALGYVPDAAARSLAVRSSRTFGLMVPDVTDPIHGQIVAGFERAAHAAGYTVIVANGLDDGSREVERSGISPVTARTGSPSGEACWSTTT